MNRLFLLLVATISLFASGVQTAVISEHNVSEVLTGYGMVRPLKSLDIVAHQAGIVTGLTRLPGETVRKGESLFLMLPKASRKEIVTLKLQVRIADEQLAYTQKEYLRIRKLYREKASYKKELNTVKNRYVLARTKADGAHEALNSVLKEHSVHAPAGGIVLSLGTINGGYVKKGETVMELTPSCEKIVVLHIFDTGSHLRSGQPLLIEADGGTYRGKVLSIAPKVAKNGARIVYGSLLSSGCSLPAESSVKGSVTITSTRTPVVPVRALLRSGSHTVVLVVSSGKYIVRKVETGLENREYVQILSGLKPGETVVTEGAYELLHKNIAKQMKILD